MNPAARRNEDSASASVLYMAMELSNKNDVIAGLPKARRGRIETKAVRLASEMIEHADSLGDKGMRAPSAGAPIVGEIPSDGGRLEAPRDRNRVD